MIAKRTLRNVLNVVLPLIIGIAIVYYLCTKLDLAVIKEILRKDLNLWVVALSMLIGLCSHIIRAYRWRLQLWELGARPKLSTVCNSIFATYAINLIVPRLGEVWRGTYIASREKLSFTQVLGSIFADRLSDTVAVGLITVTAFFAQMSLFMSFLHKFPSIEKGTVSLLSSPWLYLFAAGGLVTFILLFRSKTERNWVLQIKQAIHNLWEGFATVLCMKHKGQFILFTVLLWLSYFLQLWVCFFAFSESSHFTLLMALSLFAMGSISAALPVQGGIGAWHLAVITALTLYGVNENFAGAFAVVAHGCQMLLVMLLGIYSAIAIAWDKRRNQREISTEEGCN